MAQKVDGFDETITRTDADFASIGLKSDSLIRLGFLGTVPRAAVKGTIGVVSSTRRARLLRNLCAYLTEELAEEDVGAATYGGAAKEAVDAMGDTNG